MSEHGAVAGRPVLPLRVGLCLGFLIVGLATLAYQVVTSNRPVAIFVSSLVLDFRTYAATFSQARRRILISCGVTGSGSAWRYCVAMMTRRSLASMSRTDGWVLVRYHGASSRAASTSVGWWPVVAYQQTVRLLMTSANGVVRSTAAWSRLRAWPTPKVCLASSMATSMDQRAA